MKKFIKKLLTNDKTHDIMKLRTIALSEKIYKGENEMKKLSVLLLVLAMVLAFAACNKDQQPCESHVDDNEDGICDVCEATVDDNDDEPNTDDVCVHKDDNGDEICDTCGDPVCKTHVDADGNEACDVCGAAVPLPVGLQLSNAVIAQLEAAKSVKVELDVNASVNEDTWEYVYDEETGDYTLPENTTDYSEVVMKVIATVSEGANGGYNAKVDATVSYRYAPDGELEPDIDGTVLYIIDGVAYTYRDESDLYVKASLESEETESVMAVLEKLAAAVEITEDERIELLTLIGDSVNTAFNIKDNKGTVSADVKDNVNEIIAYFAELDLENDTLATVIDDALALVDEELTSADIVAELERISGLTVNAALAELDAWLTENYETTAQELYNTVVTDKCVVIILEEYIKANAYDVEEAELDEYVAEQLASIQSFKIADAIAEAEMGEAQVYDVLKSMMGGNAASVTDDTATGDTVTEGTEEEVSEREQFFDNIEAMLATTLAEFDASLAETSGPVFAVIKTAASGITINKLDGKIDLNFKGSFNIDTIEAIANGDMTVVTPSEVENKEDTRELKITAKVKVYDVLTTAIEIKLPEDAVIIDDIISKGLYSDYPYGELYIYSYDDAFDFDMEIYVDELNDTVMLYATGITVDELIAKAISVDAENISIYYNGSSLELLSDSALAFTIDSDEGTYTVTSCPEFEIPVLLTSVIQAIGFGEGVDNSEKYDLDAELGFYFESLELGEGKIVCDPDLHWISSILFSYYLDEEGNLVCTITGFINDSEHSAYTTDKSTVFYGGCYADREEDFCVYFDYDLEFTICVDENGVVTSYDFPVFSEEYKDVK